MNPLRFFARRSCGRKTRYQTYGQAKDAKVSAGRAREVALRVYYCDFCLGFHLTKKMLDARKSVGPD